MSPRWDELLRFNVSLPTKKEISQDIEIDLWGKNTLGYDEYLGGFLEKPVNIKIAKTRNHYKKYPKPKWYKIYSKGQDTGMKLLISFFLFKFTSKGGIIKTPKQPKLTT